MHWVPVFKKQPVTVFSVCQGAHGLEWRRPHEMVEDPRLFVGGGDRFDINQVRLFDFSTHKPGQILDFFSLLIQKLARHFQILV
jgi:hypothetical protein